MLTMALKITGDTMRNRIIYLLLGLVLSPLIAAQVAKEDQFFDELLVFGDSILDSGNFGITFTNPETDGTPGPVMSDFFAALLGLPLVPSSQGGTNYAVGGYITPEIFASITAPGGARLLVDHDDDLSTPDIDAAAPMDGYLVGNSIGANTLVFLNGGANNFLDGLMMSTDDVIQAATEMAGSIQALHAGGANYIMVANVPNLAFSPNTYATALALCAQQGIPATAPQCTGSTDSVLSSVVSATAEGIVGYNTILTSVLNTLQANIIPVDLAGALGAVIADPASFGFDAAMGAQLYQTCYSGSSCVENPVYGISNGNMPDQLFFNDGVHPTQALGEIAGDYLFDITHAPTEIALLPELGIANSHRQINSVNNRFRSSRWVQDESDQGWFIGTSYYDEQFSDNGPAADGSVVGGALNIGYGHATRNLQVGLLFNFGTDDLDIDSTASSYEAQSLGVSVFIGHQIDRYFIEGTFSLSSLDYGINRRFDLGQASFNATGDTEGFSWGLDISTGYNILPDTSRLKVAPAIGVTHIGSRVNSYVEDGGSFSNYRWGELSTKSSQLKLGLTGDLSISEAVGVSFDIFWRAEQEDELVQVTASNSSLQNNAYQLPGFQRGDTAFTSSIDIYRSFNNSKLFLNLDYSDQTGGSSSLIYNWTF